MAITTKLILRTNKILPDGGHPIVFRITENRRVYEVATKESSLANQWDKRTQCVYSNHPNHKPINALLNNIKVQVTFYFANLKEGQAPRVIAIKNIVEKLTGAIQTTPTRGYLSFLTMKLSD